LEAAAGNRVIYWALNNLYIFDGPNIYYMDTTSSQPLYPFCGPYLDALCLVDTLGGSPLPYFLVLDTRLFVIQAAPAHPIDKAWKKRRPGVLEFVLNPPDEPEIIQASVLFSLTLSIVTLSGPDHV
jgi:hypothetical protein